MDSKYYKYCIVQQLNHQKNYLIMYLRRNKYVKSGYNLQDETQMYLQIIECIFDHFD